MQHVSLTKTDSKKAVTASCDALRLGGVIMYPTDTVYGLGADATNAEAVARVSTIKGRESTKPILVMVADLAMLEQYAVVTPLARKLVEVFLPGPLAIVLEAREDTLAAVHSSDGALGFRIPEHAFCAELVKKFGKPITSTSVNRSGMKQPRSPRDMLIQLGEPAEDIDLVVEAGELAENLPSTIVDGRGEKVVILREGAVLRSALGSFV